MSVHWTCDSCKRPMSANDGRRYGLIIPEWGEDVTAHIVFLDGRIYCHMCTTEAMNDKPEVQFL